MSIRSGAHEFDDYHGRSPEIAGDYARPVDGQQPLPPTVCLFEERATWRGLARRVGLSVLFIVLDLLLIASGVVVTQAIGEGAFSCLSSSAWRAGLPRFC